MAGLLSRMQTERLGSPLRPIRVISTFCGFGGADLGLYAAADEAGISVETVAAYDVWEPAVKAYNLNLPHPVAQLADVKKLRIEDLPAHDLLIGGPPCQPFSNAGLRLGSDDARDCIPDFIRLTKGCATPYVMENVVGGLLAAHGVKSYNAELCAAAFGDATNRWRHFYTNIGQIVVSSEPRLFRNPSDIEIGEGVRQARIGDIRDHAADESLRKKMVDSGREVPDMLPLLAMRQNSSRPPDLYADGDRLGTVVWNTWHAASAPDMEKAIEADCDYSTMSPRPWARCPSLLEMSRAHSVPDGFEWGGATKAQRGKMVANSWPVGLAKAVMKATLLALVRSQKTTPSKILTRA